MLARSRRGRAPLEQLHLPLEEADIRQNKKAPGVYRDHNAHHAIVYKIGKTKISFIEMKKMQAGHAIGRGQEILRFAPVRTHRVSA